VSQLNELNADFLQRGVSRGQAEGYDSDDVASETSSMCSESAMRGYGSRAQTEVVLWTV